MKRFFQPTLHYIFETYFYTMFRGYERDVKKELQYVDIPRLLMTVRAETTGK